MTQRRVFESVDPFAECEPSPREVLAALTADDWAQLESLVERIAAHRGPFGHWVPPEKRGDNSYSLGYPVFGPLMQEAFEYAYAHGFVMPGFDWPRWYGERTAGADVADTDLGEAPPEVVLGLITAYIRGDRFSDGALMEAFDDGVMPRLLARLLDFAPQANEYPSDMRISR